MIRLSFNLPAKRRLDLHLVKRRGSADDVPLFPNLEKIRRIKKGSKISRTFRHFFEHKKIHRFLGANLVLASLVSPFVSTSPNTLAEYESPNISNTPIVFTTERRVRYPLEKVKVTQEYKFYHPGIDLSSPSGEPVYPITNGKIEAIQYSRYGYGNAIVVDHGNKITSLYAHLSKINIANNQEVSTNTKIGEVGSTGYSSGSHLHLEIRDAGYPINPLTILPSL
jgi:murein DD-endopeptidase MepM/ murein hydrolase activator NlpD